MKLPVQTRTIQKPVTYDGKRLNDAVDALLMWPFLTGIAGFFGLIAIIFSMDDSVTKFCLVVIVGLIDVLAWYSFLKYVSVVQGGEPESVTEHYVEIPERKPINRRAKRW